MSKFHAFIRHGIIKGQSHTRNQAVLVIVKLMSVLSAHNLSKSYGAQDVFQDVSLDVSRGAKIALVGPNGMGKSTLLNLIIGLESPSQGTIHKAKETKLGYLPQRADFSAEGSLWEAMLAVFVDLDAQAAELRRLESTMAHSGSDIQEQTLERYGRALEAFELAGGYTFEQRIKRILSGLGFGENEFHRPLSQFSGGERTRALLARLLLEEPTVLLLDEPTNYLDLDGIEWLEGYLKAWHGALIIVSHDRAFLDAVVDEVWELAWGRLEQFRGNYSAYAIQRAERAERQNVEYERQRAHITETEDFIHRNMAGQLSRQAKGRLKRISRIELIERPKEYQPLHLSLGDVTRSGDFVLGLDGLCVGYEGDPPVCRTEKLEIRRGERIALIGPNGTGKTTLVRTILNEIPPISVHVRFGSNVELGYFAQGQSTLDADKSVLDTILDSSGMLISEARSFLGSYRFSGDDVFKKVGTLSGGEQARVALALLALQGANFLLLDEPTNHLDIPSQEVLQDVLMHFAGTLLIVSHDRYLIDKLATNIWVIEGEQIHAFKGGYTSFRAWERENAETRLEQKTPEQSKKDIEREVRRSAQRETARIARQQAEIEDRIHQLEDRLAELAAQLAAASELQAVEQVTQLGSEYHRIEAQLNKLLRAWIDIER